VRESRLGYVGKSYMILILYIEDVEATLNSHHEFARPVRRDMWYVSCEMCKEKCCCRRRQQTDIWESSELIQVESTWAGMRHRIREDAEKKRHAANMIRRKRRRVGESGVFWTSGAHDLVSVRKECSDTSQDARDSWDAEYPVLALGRNPGGSDPRFVFADLSPELENRLGLMSANLYGPAPYWLLKLGKQEKEFHIIGKTHKWKSPPQTSCTSN